MYSPLARQDGVGGVAGEGSDANVNGAARATASQVAGVELHYIPAEAKGVPGVVAGGGPGLREGYVQIRVIGNGGEDDGDAFL